MGIITVNDWISRTIEKIQTIRLQPSKALQTKNHIDQHKNKVLWDRQALGDHLNLEEKS